MEVSTTNGRRAGTGARGSSAASPDAEARAFSEHLARVRAEVDRLLEARWETKLRALDRHGPSVVAMAAASRDLTLRGGKRFRAALLAAAYAGTAPAAPPAVALDGGVAMELLQTYLLIQDDWIDGDDLRRGGPSVHAALAVTLGNKALGHASAILASDLTWGFALEVLAGCGAPPARLVEAIRLFAEVHEHVVIGQELDVLGDAADVEAMHALKTGSYTVRGPLLLGATLAGARRAVITAFETFAQPLGVAFQLRDDLLGTFGTEAETGKPEGGDLRAGKRTAVIAEAEPRLDARGKKALAQVFGRKEASAASVAAAASALEACGARAAVAARLSELCDGAAETARRLPTSPDARAILAGAAGALRMPGEVRAAGLGDVRAASRGKRGRGAT